MGSCLCVALLACAFWWPVGRLVRYRPSLGCAFVTHAHASLVRTVEGLFAHVCSCGHRVTSSFARAGWYLVSVLAWLLRAPATEGPAPPRGPLDREGRVVSLSRVKIFDRQVCGESGTDVGLAFTEEAERAMARADWQARMVAEGKNVRRYAKTDAATVGARADAQMRTADAGLMSMEEVVMAKVLADWLAQVDARKAEAAAAAAAVAAKTVMEMKALEDPREEAAEAKGDVLDIWGEEAEFLVYLVRPMFVLVERVSGLVFRCLLGGFVPFGHGTPPLLALVARSVWCVGAGPWLCFVVSAACWCV